MSDLIIISLIGLFLVVIGIFFTRERLLFLIAGYNTMPIEQKLKVNKKRMGKNVGRFCIAIGISTIVMGILLDLFFSYAAIITAIFVVAILVSSALLIIIQNRELKEKND